jgi:hypothetical protein
MDEQVLSALARWPNVPAVTGWLALTARGQWLIAGAPVGHAGIRDFIGRNYAHDAQGRYYFQNGPQRVYVSLAATPFVYRLEPDGRVTAHTGAAPAQARGAALLDDGRFVLATELGPGLVDDRDAAWFVRAITDVTGRPLNERGFERWMDGADEAYLAPRLLRLPGELLRVERLRADEPPRRYGFVREPTL